MSSAVGFLNYDPQTTVILSLKKGGQIDQWMMDRWMTKDMDRQTEIQYDGNMAFSSNMLVLAEKTILLIFGHSEWCRD